ncbi:hypothetical protein PSTG_05298 [Puccinia striiformis f. sp. tritici PST-78]|uniref:Uncharacterized protein n=1 Tax=Puccinia striiformis f. sp. tritici PST-78 TaxID=1165861 RepID=A0A0L0VQG6_9BASI|nr:hypothetical protein PSTG_05298 [Puccinia striiformis f. sp. tritici PST-78]
MWSKPTAKFTLLALVIQISIIVCQAQAPLKLQKPGIKQTKQDKQRAVEVKTAFTGIMFCDLGKEPMSDKEPRVNNTRDKRRQRHEWDDTAQEDEGEYQITKENKINRIRDEKWERD